MSRAIDIGFAHVMLTAAVMLVSVPRTLADTLDIRVSTSINPNTSTDIKCPTQTPAPDPIPLQDSIQDTFVCTISVAEVGDFLVYGYINAVNHFPPGATGVSALLSFNATVVAKTPVTADVDFVLFAEQRYAIPPPPTILAGTFVTSSMTVNGICDDPRTSVNAMNFFVGGEGVGTSTFPINPASIACKQTPVFSASGNSSPVQIGTGLILQNSGGIEFPPGSQVGDAVHLETQQVAVTSTGGVLMTLPPPATVSVTCVLPLPGNCADVFNEFIPPPDPSNGFVIVYAGDVRSVIDIVSMEYDPTVNAFAYQFPYQSTASMSLDTSGNTVNTVVTFSGPAISNTDIFCYNGPSTCNNNPHFGVNAVAQSCVGVTCPTLKALTQYWTNTPTDLLPGLSVSGPGLTGQAIQFVTVFASVAAGGHTVGQWFAKPYTTNAAPQLCLVNNMAFGETLSDVGVLATPVAILPAMNFGMEPPPGQPGSPFTSVPSLNGTFLPAGGNVCFIAPLEPDIAVTNGSATGSGVLSVAVNLNNTGGTDASKVTISGVRVIAPATYVGPALPVTVGGITAGTTASQNIQINTSGMASGSVARFQITGSYLDGAGNSYQFSSVRGVTVP